MLLLPILKAKFNTSTQFLILSWKETPIAMASDAEDIESSWITAVESFEKKTGIKMNVPETELKEIKEKIDNAADTAQGNAGSKDVMKKSIDFVLDLGKIASDAVSSTRKSTESCTETSNEQCA